MEVDVTVTLLTESNNVYAFQVVVLGQLKNCAVFNNIRHLKF